MENPMFWCIFLITCISRSAEAQVQQLVVYLSGGLPSSPTCDKYEHFYWCKPPNRTCAARFEPFDDCEPGCDCRSNFYRLEEGSPCVHVSNCPKPECEENEIFQECGPGCEYCNGLPCATIECTYRCFCKPGYLRLHNRTCVPASECNAHTIQAQCMAHEVLLQKGPSYEYCSEEKGETVDHKKCYCLPNHKRNRFGLCVNVELCSKALCDVGQTFQTCATSCNKTCANYGEQQCSENEPCFQGCFCSEGYLLHNYGVCVKPDQCDSDEDPAVMRMVEMLSVIAPFEGDSDHSDSSDIDSRHSEIDIKSYSGYPESEEDEELRKGLLGDSDFIVGIIDDGDEEENVKVLNPAFVLPMEPQEFDESMFFKETIMEDENWNAGSDDDEEMKDEDSEIQPGDTIFEVIDEESGAGDEIYIQTLKVPSEKDNTTPQQYEAATSSIDESQQPTATTTADKQENTDGTQSNVDTTEAHENESSTPDGSLTVSKTTPSSFENAKTDAQTTEQLSLETETTTSSDIAESKAEAYDKTDDVAP